MDYNKIYDQIINRALNANRLKNTGIYFESHHIIPKSLGGTNNSNNLVLLTAKEHFIAHKLLCEIYPDNTKLKYSLWAMMNLSNRNQRRIYKISSREYEMIRFEYSKLMSLPKSEKHKQNISKSWTIERKQQASALLSEKNKLRVKDKHPLYGKTRPEHSEWLKQNHPMKGKTHSEETKNKIRKSLEQTRLKKIGERNG
jgi:hypothetical protein